MKFKNEEFTYYLTSGKVREYIIGLEQYFKEYKVEEDEKVHLSKFISSPIIGTLMFELLQREDIEYSNNTLDKIEYIKFYLDRCIENNEYCNNSIFLPCIQNTINVHLPNSDFLINDYYTIEQRCNYNVINAEPKEKTNIIFNNRNNIKFEKVYYCKKIEELFVASLFEVFDSHYIIRKCKNCKKFFVTIEQGKRIKYCYNTSPQDKNKTCYQYCSQQTYVEKRKNDPVRHTYSRLYNKYNNSYMRAKYDNIKKYEKEKEDAAFKKLEELKNIYEHMRNSIKSGKITKEEVYLYLKDYENGGKEKWQLRN